MKDINKFWLENYGSELEEVWEENSYEDYTSSTSGDYSPSNPWDAPGMSIRDFL